MKSTVTKEKDNKRLVEVEMSDAELSPHFDTHFRKYQKNVRLEGFRKGKVPLPLIKKLYGDHIRSEAIDEVVQTVFKEVTKSEDLRPVAPAKLKDIHYHPGSGLTFKASVEVLPEIELKHYHKLSVERELYELSEEDINLALEDLREQMAVLNPFEGPAEEGHFVLADFQQLDVSGVPIVGKKFEDRFFQLTNEDGNRELASQLIGANAGDSRRVELPIADESKPNENKTQLYSVQVKEIKQKELPALDDELAKDVGNFETLEALKSDIEQKLQQRATRNSQRQLRDRLIDETLKRNSFDLPEGMIDHYLEAFWESAKNQSKGEVDEAALKTEFRPRAIWNLKWEIVKEKIAQLENIQASDDDTESFIRRFAEERDVDETKLRETLRTKQGRDRFKDDILDVKVLDFLEEHAKIKDRKISRKDVEKTKGFLRKK